MGPAGIEPAHEGLTAPAAPWFSGPMFFYFFNSLVSTGQVRPEGVAPSSLIFQTDPELSRPRSPGRRLVVQFSIQTPYQLFEADKGQSRANTLYDKCINNKERKTATWPLRPG